MKRKKNGLPLSQLALSVQITALSWLQSTSYRSLTYLLTINAHKSIYSADDLPQLNYHSLHLPLCLYTSSRYLSLFSRFWMCLPSQFHRTDRDRLIAAAGRSLTCIIQVTGSELFGDTHPPHPKGRRRQWRQRRRWWWWCQCAHIHGLWHEFPPPKQSQVWMIDALLLGSDSDCEMNTGVIVGVVVDDIVNVIEVLSTMVANKYFTMVKFHKN